MAKVSPLKPHETQTRSRTRRVSTTMSSKRALRWYLDKTKDLRVNRTWLFIFFKAWHKKERHRPQHNIFLDKGKIENRFPRLFRGKRTSLQITAHGVRAQAD